MIALAQILMKGTSDLPTPIVLLVMAAAIGMRFAAVRWDRQRIREHVEGSGGKVLDIASNSLWGWRGTRDRTYQVTYRTNHGRVITATCGTSMSSGVYWRGGVPPGFYLRESPTEPIDCLECRAKIPAGQTHCPKCGWSYQTNEAANPR